MSIRNDQCKKVCKILDDALANRPQERDALIVAVQTAFKALTEDGWIPCSEQLPEEKEVVLVTYYFRGVNKIEPSYYIDIAYRDGDNWSSYLEEYMIARDRYEVVAWRELPKPYQPKEDKHND